MWDGGHGCHPVRPRNVKFFGGGGGAEASSRSGSCSIALQPSGVLNEHSFAERLILYTECYLSLLCSSTRDPSRCWEWRGNGACPHCHQSVFRSLATATVCLENRRFDTEVEVEVENTLRPTVSLGVRLPPGTRHQFFFSLRFFFRHFRVYFVAPYLTRGRVCNFTVAAGPRKRNLARSAISDERSCLSFVSTGTDNIKLRHWVRFRASSIHSNLIHIFIYGLFNDGARGMVSWLRHYSMSRKIAGFILEKCRWILHFAYCFQPYNGPWVDSASNKNEYQLSFLGGGVKRCRRVRVTTSPPFMSLLSG
jgi:hypothetical protein